MPALPASWTPSHEGHGDRDNPAVFEVRSEPGGQAREFTTTALDGWGLRSRVEDIRPCVSELAINALVHGSEDGQGSLARLDADEEAVHLDVHDSRDQHPLLCRASDTAPSGRGPALADALADGWGVKDRTPLGEIVWSRFRLSPVLQPKTGATQTPP
ncbi:ATP-binding protein [Streptomyces sp. NPDC058657]|uniref:ATP-binding protein n=1 Tax=unclassified Streptomyces TaxID=2593676 RepID=UPI003652D6ED